jgi:hypothetical protein
MLATFFVHDDEGWRLKGHAATPFYRWLASWGMSVRKPSDIGYTDEGYDLPELRVIQHVVPSGITETLKGVASRARMRKQTVEARVAKAVEIAQEQPDSSWLFWCGRNDESHLATQGLNGAVEVEGSDTPQHKAESFINFAEGQTRVLVTKPDIAGFGLNFQRCSRMVFVGIGDSFEQYYQAIRRCWRFGQTQPVEVHVVLSDIEVPVFENVLRKQAESDRMRAQLAQHVAQFEREEIEAVNSKFVYQPERKMLTPPWLQGDASNASSGSKSNRQLQLVLC